jgi:hypothetical protein
MNKVGEKHTELWDEEDGFYYDVLNLPSGNQLKLKVRSLVGLIPLFAVQTLDPELLEGISKNRYRQGKEFERLGETYITIMKR